MNDFNRRFRAREEEFDKEWKQAEKLYWIGSVVMAIIGLSLTGFFVWVVVMTMKYLGII